jgi:hypothetical protein
LVTGDADRHEKFLACRTADRTAGICGKPRTGELLPGESKCRAIANAVPDDEAIAVSAYGLPRKALETSARLDCLARNLPQ